MTTYQTSTPPPFVTGRRTPQGRTIITIRRGTADQRADLAARMKPDRRGWHIIVSPSSVLLVHIPRRIA